MLPVTIINRLADNADVFAALLANVDADQARWKPSADRWALVEVVCHLADEERLDFRARLQALLSDPQKPWSRIDPQGWVTKQRYFEQDFAAAREDFLGERRASTGWLRQLQHPDWRKAREMPGYGLMSASNLLACWLAHDLHHIRQINALHHDYLDMKTGPGALRYAGDW